jgi:hypothetical protein
LSNSTEIRERGVSRIHRSHRKIEDGHGSLIFGCSDRSGGCRVPRSGDLTPEAANQLLLRGAKHVLALAIPLRDSDFGGGLWQLAKRRIDDDSRADALLRFLP